MHKHSKRPPPSRDRQTVVSKPQSIPSSAYIQAYESHLIYDQRDRAEELYSKEPSGRGLMRWQGYGGSDRPVWADRHDILHLLDELPNTSHSSREHSPTPSSSSSWDSLPSDLEETFHLSDPHDIEEYERTKRTRWVEQLREARLKEREEEDRQSGLLGDEDKGKGKAPSWPENEIPPHSITTLMSHTATSLLASPKPKVLESRILLNHASDERFDFLKGRWKLTWERAMKDARAKRDIATGRAEKEKKAITGLIGTYDSDSDGDESEPEDVEPPPPPVEDLSPPPSPPSNDDIGVTLDPDPKQHGDTRPTPESSQAMSASDTTDDAEKQRLRRLKAEEWKKTRALGKAA